MKVGLKTFVVVLFPTCPEEFVPQQYKSLFSVKAHDLEQCVIFLTTLVNSGTSAKLKFAKIKKLRKDCKLIFKKFLIKFFIKKFDNKYKYGNDNLTKFINIFRI